MTEHRGCITGRFKAEANTFGKLIAIQEAYNELFLGIDNISVKNYQNVCTNAPLYLKDLIKDAVPDEILRLRKLVLVHSCLYYCMDTSLVDDHTWQNWANNLAKLQEEYPIESRLVGYYYEEFIDFDGSTGHDLPCLKEDVVWEAQKLLQKAGKPRIEPHLPI